jgi:hypothetical protein
MVRGFAWRIRFSGIKGDRKWLGDMGSNDALLYSNNYVLYDLTQKIFFEN